MKIGSKFSNRTKILGGATILFGAAAIISGVKDHLGLKALEESSTVDAAEEIINELPDIAVGEVVEF